MKGLLPLQLHSISKILIKLERMEMGIVFNIWIVS